VLGTHIGQYKIVKKIGAGGMGLVFLAEHTLLGRRAAIKTLLPTLSVNREIAERFFNEARATSSISDPGVIQIFDFGYHVDGTAYIVMELLEGEALSARIDRLGKLPIADALRIAMQGAASLSAAHTKNIVHRDLKPENIFLVHDAEARGGERTKILDFGICKISGSNEATLTESGAMIGTPVYMSPEQCRGADDVDHRSDIYAFGCLIFHMLTGRPPFTGNSSGELIVAHLREQPPIASSLVPELTPEIDALLSRCLAKTPEERFQSMDDLQATIEDIATHLPAVDVSIPVAKKSMLLGEGFRSVYDGSFGSPAPLSSAPVTADLHARIKLSTPMASQGDEDEIEPRPRRSGLRALLTIALVAGLIGGGVTASVLLGNDEAAAQTTPAVAAVPSTAPAPTLLPEPAPAPQPSEPVAAAPEPDAMTPAPATETNPTPATDTPPPAETSPTATTQLSPTARRELATRAATMTVKKQPAKPRPRPVTRKSQSASPSSPVEDLYDTR
jgi:serine/threonine protein kinase